MPSPACKLLLDDGDFTPLRYRPALQRPARFVDSKPYSERLRGMQQATSLSDAMIAAEGRLDGRAVQICAMEPRFIGGSMGSVVGEMIMRAIERAIDEAPAADRSSPPRAARACRKAPSA